VKKTNQTQTTQKLEMSSCNQTSQHSKWKHVIQNGGLKMEGL